MITPENVLRHELIGLKVKITKATDSTIAGKSGEVFDESRNMLTIKAESSFLKVAKKDCTFLFTIPSKKKVEVKGSILVARPEDRVKKKFI